MPTINYPGVTGVLSLEYTTSVGITPGIAAITAYPDSEPALTGELEFADGVNPDTIVLPNCLLQYSETVVSGKDRVKILRLLDRRWEWRYAFPIKGHYNQTGPNQKYIPWTVRSPYQLARLCLAAMGEYTFDGAVGDAIDLPGGLASAAIPGVIPPVGPDDKVVDPVADYLGLGQNVPQTVTNQLAIWSEMPAAHALQALCDLYGRVVVLDPLTDFVRIEKLGEGDDIPAGGLRVSEGASVTGEPIPKEVVAVGSPTRFTTRVFCRAVGQDWDGSWQPINRLSYAPIVAGQKMLVHVLAKYDADSVYQIKFRVDKYSAEDLYIGSGGDMNAQIDSIVTDLNIDHGAIVTASRTTNDRGDTVLQIEAVDYGHEFELTTDGSSIYGAGRWDAECVVGPIADAAELQRVTTVDYTALTINDADDVVMTLNGTPYSVTVDTGAGMTAEAAIAAVAAAADAGTANITITPGGRIITLTGANSGITFTVSGDVNSAPATVTAVVTAPAVHRGFEKSWGEVGWNAIATDRLDKIQAKSLADKTVFRCYQAVCVNPSDHTDKTIPVPGWPPKEVEVDFGDVVIAVGETISITLDGNTYTSTAIPGDTLESLVEDLAGRVAGNGHQVRVTFSGAYIWITANAVGYNFTLTAASSAGDVTVTVATEGIDNRYRLVLQNTRPEPITPRPGDANILDGQTLQPYAAETYNGYSVDRPNEAYGSFWLGQAFNAGVWLGAQYFGNTLPRTKIPIKFSLIDPERQIFAFEQPVYRILGRDAGFACLPPDLVIECGTLVLDNDLAPVRYSYTTKIVGGTAPPMLRVFPDIQQEVVATFDEMHLEAEHHQLDSDASIRGQYYSEAMRDVLHLPEGEHSQYGGIRQIGLGGLIRQVKWSINRGGPTTTASTNSEFSKVIPPFAIRRRAENQLPDSLRVMQNLSSELNGRQFVRNALLGMLGGAVGAGKTG